MPRNGSGVYTLPAGNPVITGTVISSTTQNNTMSDVASELTNSIAADGQKAPTANLPMGGFRHTGVADANARNQYASAGQVQDSSLVWCGTAAGTADALEFSPNPAITSYVVGQTFKFQAGAAANTSATTIAISGLTAIDLQINGVACSGGEIQPNLIYEVFIDTTSTAQLRDVSKSVDGGASIISIDASVASNILTCTLNPVSLDFRSATIGSGAINMRTAPVAITVAVPSTATLGTFDGVLARLILIAIDNAGTVELAIANWKSTAALDESSLISTTTISTGADSANTFYSTTGRSNVPYRVVGFVEVTQVTAGTWVSPSKIQGFGGEALIYLGVPYVAPALPPKYIDGLLISNNATDSNNDIDISVGDARDSANAYNLSLASILTKRLDATWAAGTNQGGLFSGSKAANTWYHIFLIRKDSDGTIDAGFDTSLTAANKPSGYSNYRHIFSIRTDGSSNIISGRAMEIAGGGVRFDWDIANTDVNVSDLGTSPVGYTIRTPLGYETEAYVGVYASKLSTAVSIDVYYPNKTAQTAINASGRGFTTGASTASSGQSMRTIVRTNTISQVYAVADTAACNLGISTYG